MQEIFAIIGEIGARKLAPVHTQGTELFPEHMKVEKGKRVEL
jgi:hypothetical protein